MSGRKAPTPAPDPSTKPPPPPPIPPKKGTVTLLGLPLVLVASDECSRGEIIIGSDLNGSLLAVGKILAGIKEDPK